jgi:hypothetical protein
MMASILTFIYLIGLVGGFTAIPILRGYHRVKYKYEWSIEYSCFKSLPAMGEYIAVIALWPLVLIAYPTYHQLKKLVNVGEYIAKRQKLKTERNKQLKTAELEVERMLSE